MIKKVVIKKFRSFDDDIIELRSEGVSLLVGGNNSGKSTFLYALSTWSYCCNVLVNEKRPMLWVHLKASGKSKVHDL